MGDNSSEYNVLDVLLMRNKKYIVLFSGLDFSPVEKIANDLAKDFNSTVLNFIHLGLEDSLDPVNTRVSDLLDKSKINTNPKPLFVIGKTFPSSKLKIPVDLHIHISLHQIAILRLDPLKRQDLPAKYVESIKTNRVNKYINLQKEYSIDKIEDDIFNIIVGDIEKKVYGDQYETLGSKSSTQTQSQPKPQPTQTSKSSKSSELKFNPNVPSIKEIKEEVTKKAEEEIQDSIDSAEDSLSAEKDLDNSSDDFLSDEVRVLGSGFGSRSRQVVSDSI